VAKVIVPSSNERKEYGPNGESLRANDKGELVGRT